MPTRRHALVAALALALAGCPASKDEPVQLLENQATPGTRLRPQFVRGENLRLFRGWRDTARGEDCGFRTAADGVLRCLPGAAGLEAFANDQCTEPALVVGVLAPCLLPSHALVRVGADACDSRLRVLSLGPALAKVYAREPGGGCLEAGPPEGTLAFRAGAELDPASFVGARRDVDPAVRGLAITRLAAADGATGELQLQDAASGSPCAPGGYGSRIRCLPISLASTSPPAFGNDVCTEPAAYPRPCPGVAFAYLTLGVPGTPGGVSDFEIRPLGAETPIFSRANAFCMPVDSAPDAGRLLGPVVSPDRFVTGTFTTAGERLRIDAVRFEGVTPLAAMSMLLDANLGDVWCMPHVAADGQVRCLPAGASAILPTVFFGRWPVLYADDQCGDLLAFGTGLQARVESPAACPRIVHIHRAGAAYDGPVFGRDAGGGCAEQPGWAYPGDVYRLGEELPAAGFVPMTLE